MIIDCQSHWYPLPFFEALLGRRDYPCARKERGELYFDFTRDTSLKIEEYHVNLALQLQQMEDVGIDAVVSSPASLAIEALPAAEAQELAQLLNEEVARAQRHYRGRFYGLATLPLQSSDKAIAILDDAVGRLELRGVHIPSNVNGQPLDSDHLRPVYARIDELNAPMFIHPTKTIFSSVLSRFGLEYIAGNVFDTTVAALTLVFGGILEEFTGLTFVHPHAGGTVPFLAGRIDHEYSKPWALGRKLDRPPSEYLREFYTDTVSLSRGALALALSFYGGERVLFGSDYPWWPSGDSLEVVRSAFDGTELQAVLGGNAVRLLDI
jgi:predicted TIM-barrel fold metal-dependent hydrolase